MAARFGERGRRTVRREFTVEGHVDSSLRVLRSVAEHDEGGPRPDGRESDSESLTNWRVVADPEWTVLAIRPRFQPRSTGD